MEAVPREFRDAFPWELLYAHDLVVIRELNDQCSMFRYSDEKIPMFDSDSDI